MGSSLHGDYISPPFEEPECAFSNLGNILASIPPQGQHVSSAVSRYPLQELIGIFSHASTVIPLHVWANSVYYLVNRRVDQQQFGIDSKGCGVLHGREG